MSQSTTVTADHLRRLACLYVRQSSLQQVHDHQESTARQYARAHSRFPGHALTPTGVMAIRCKQFHLPDL